MNPEVKSPVLVTPEAVRTMNEILSRGKGVELAVRNGRLVLWETASKKKYEAGNSHYGLLVRVETLLPIARFVFDFNAARLEMVSEDLKTQKGENPTKNGK